MFSIYFAGDLFDHKHLAGNELLAEQIEQQSKGRYQCVLPQKFPLAKDAHECRNNCLEAIIRADLALFNFDGPDVDSGTMVEFTIAKMLDIPSVIIRSDFRNGAYWGANWNLMAAFFPRCVEVTYPSLMPYKQHGLTTLNHEFGRLIVTALDSVASQPAQLNTPDSVAAAYKHVVAMCGDRLAERVADLALIIDRKQRNNLYGHGATWTSAHDVANI